MHLKLKLLIDVTLFRSKNTLNAPSERDCALEIEEMIGWLDICIGSIFTEWIGRLVSWTMSVVSLLAKPAKFTQSEARTWWLMTTIKTVDSS